MTYLYYPGGREAFSDDCEDADRSFDQKHCIVIHPFITGIKETIFVFSFLLAGKHK
jgi:hypothetical protein